MQCSCSSQLGEFTWFAGVSSLPVCRLMKAHFKTKEAVTAERETGRWDLLISHPVVSAQSC